MSLINFIRERYFIGPSRNFAEKYGFETSNQKVGRSPWNATTHAYTSLFLHHHLGSTIASTLGALKEMTAAGSEYTDTLKDEHNNMVGLAVGDFAKSNNLDLDQAEGILAEVITNGLTAEYEMDPRTLDPLTSHIFIKDFINKIGNNYLNQLKGPANLEPEHAGGGDLGEQGSTGDAGGGDLGGQGSTGDAGGGDLSTEGGTSITIFEVMHIEGSPGNSIFEFDPWENQWNEIDSDIEEEL